MIRVSTRIIGGREALVFDGTCIFQHQCEKYEMLGYSLVSKERYSYNVWMFLQL